MSAVAPLRRPTRIVPGKIIEAIDGVVVRDPYRELEEDSQRTLEWQAAETDRAIRQLRGPRFQELLANARAFMHADEVFAPVATEAGWFRPSGDGELILSDSLDGPGVVLRPGIQEPQDRDQPAFSWYQPSPDGRFLAYGASEGGGLQGGAQLLRLRILDVSTGNDLPIRIPHATADVGWLPDSTGLYVVHGLGHASANPERRIGFQSLEGGFPFKPEPLRGLGFDARVSVSPDGRFTAVQTGKREPRADWLLDRETGEWRSFLMHVPAACFGAFSGDNYIALTTWKSPNGRIVSIPLSAADDLSSWREIVPEGPGVIRGLSIVERSLVVLELVDAVSRLRIVALDGTEITEVPLPCPGTVSTSGPHGWFQTLGPPAISPGVDGFAYVHSDYDRSPALYWHDLKEQISKEVAAPRMTTPNIAIVNETFQADDGEEVPAVLVSRKGQVKPGPAIIFCYGAYNFATVPGWIGVLGPFVEAGGIAVFAHLRGGGEFGTLWWRAGHHENKQRSFDDIYAVAEGLVRGGWTTTDQLGVLGLSNGGTNVCTAIVQRPGLFRAGVALAPQCDLLRYSRDPFCGGAAITGHHQGLHVNSGIWRDPAWGRGEQPKPAGPAHFPQAMHPDPLSYSPYHLVEDGVSYPALLLVCGSEDVWCPAWHSRKLAARMQAATASSNPILLRCWEGAGHEDPMAQPEQVAEWLAFFMEELGMNDKGPIGS